MKNLQIETGSVLLCPLYAPGFRSDHISRNDRIITQKKEGQFGVKITYYRGSCAGFRWRFIRVFDT
jgi:hypothetical protein